MLHQEEEGVAREGRRLRRQGGRLILPRRPYWPWRTDWHLVERSMEPPLVLGEGDFRALLLHWGNDQVDEGQHDEWGVTHQCYFVAAREACAVAGLEVWPAAVIRRAVLDKLQTQHWTDFFESPVYGHVMVGEGPPGAPPRAGQ